ADIKEMSAFEAEDGRRFSLALHRLGDLMEAVDVPVIAAVNGYALGGGCELLLACDFAIASEKASFGLPEVGLGVMPGFGGTTRLTRRVGEARARQMVFTGKPIDAVEAFRIGLVNEVVGHDELGDRVAAVAAQIRRNAPLSIAYAKRSLRHGAESDLKSANAFEAQTFGLCFATKDQKEGMTAFIEKRAPQWTGE
ncbi:MAG: enoyl-CoA hydratase-related protein, partial [Myxococcota bacterium]